MLAVLIQLDFCWILHSSGRQGLHEMIEFAKEHENNLATVIFVTPTEDPALQHSVESEADKSRNNWTLKQNKYFTNPYVALELTYSLCSANEIVLLRSPQISTIDLAKEAAELDFVVFSDRSANYTLQTRYVLEDVLSGALEVSHSSIGAVFTTALLARVFSDDHYVEMANRYQRAPDCVELIFWLFAAENAEKAAILSLEHHDSISKGEIEKTKCESEVLVMMGEIPQFVEYADYLRKYLIGGVDL